MMIPHRLTGLPDAVTGNAAHATGTHGPEGDGAQNLHPQTLVERLGAYGFHADTVSTNVTWWLPFAHPRSIAPLGSGVTVSWQL